ncbi:hypothetical protein BDQ17DRAFT_516547 [Cyathus striatus]|nr:hypothetical protein BDQ17DRAFT_516547 [Cyathus striatus]
MSFKPIPHEPKFPGLVLPPLPRFPESFSRTSNQHKQHVSLPPMRDLLAGPATAPIFHRSLSPANVIPRRAYTDALRPPENDFSDSPMEDLSDEDNDSLASPLSTERALEDSFSSDRGSPHPSSYCDASGSESPQPVGFSERNISTAENLSRRSSGKLAKKKKVKYHECEVCHKLFPRPSGLRTHMHIHNNEKPYECSFPGCGKRFSVVSNAKRHERTHGVGLSPADEQPALPCVVDFSAPVVPPNSALHIPKEPLNLRWMPPGVDTRRGRFHQMSASPPSSGISRYILICS